MFKAKKKELKERERKVRKTFGPGFPDNGFRGKRVGPRPHHLKREGGQTGEKKKRRETSNGKGSKCGGDGIFGARPQNYKMNEKYHTALDVIQGRPQIF